MRLFSRRLVLWILAATTMGFSTSSASASAGKESGASLNDGYSTFYHFCDQESELSLLFWVKSSPHDIADYAARISSTAKDDMAILKKFGVRDSTLRLDKVSLPSFELSVRKSMDVDRQQQLIFGSSGAAFAQAICMTQSEATNYGLHVAKVLAEMEPDPARARAMQQIYAKWLALHAEAYRLAK